MRRFPAAPSHLVRLSALGLLAALAGCEGAGEEAPAGGSGGKGDDLEGECVEPCDFDDTILIAGDGGRLVMQTLGRAPRRIDLEVETAGRFVHATSRGGRFAALFSDGVVATIDGATGALVGRAEVGGARPFAIEMRTRREAFVSFAGSATVQRIDLESGAALSSIDVAGGVADLTARHMLVVGDELFVAGALGSSSSPRGSQLAVVDLASGAIARSAELIWRHPDGAIEPAFNPTLPLVLDAPFGRIFVGATGERPVNTGLHLAVDLATLAVDPRPEDLSGAFNGARVISHPLRKVIGVEHTSTPVASTHAYAMDVLDDGRFVQIAGPPLFDLFEETNDLALNEAGTLAMLANRCPTGFCISGRGVTFVDVETTAVLPKLTEETIGFAPFSSVFLRDAD